MENYRNLSPEERHQLRLQDIISRKIQTGLTDDQIGFIDEVIKESELEKSLELEDDLLRRRFAP